MKSEIAKFEKKLKKYLDKERFVHTQGVMYTAAALAMAHGTVWKKPGLPDCFMTVQNVFPTKRNGNYVTNIMFCFLNVNSKIPF